MEKAERKARKKAKKEKKLSEKGTAEGSAESAALEEAERKAAKKARKAKKEMEKAAPASLDVAEISGSGAATSSKRKESTPPDGYVCRACGDAGHWIQQCQSKQGGGKKRKKASGGHVHVPGVDPSEDDIARAKEMQKLPPPNCKCGAKARLAKVKQSPATLKFQKQSPATGMYFFFCAKKKFDPTKCTFAQPIIDGSRDSQKSTPILAPGAPES